MKKIITTLTAVTFALGLAAAAQAQMAKTPEKPVVQTTQAVQPQVAPKPGDPVAKETVKPGDKAKEAAQSVDKGKTKEEAKKAAPKGAIEKKAGAPMEKTQEGTK
ncbi:MAG: hypothetical protein Q8L00_03200 [Deltaproteobacteria bacterium]|nr:hypothetical protein [Deltaproteobacteria bacterium]